MNNFKTYTFLINPVSGGARKDWIEILNARKPEGKSFIYKVWKNASDKDKLCLELEQSESEVLVAIGGDGTINLLAGIALKRNKVLGIIPAGSGNGLARHLKIPMNYKKSIDRLLNAEVQKMDVGSVNGLHFLCTAGVGFDALIGKEFASRDNTGFMGYVSKVLKHVFSYEAEEYELQLGDLKVNKKALMITFANASQYGNNAFIAPKASVLDGQLNISLMRPFPLIFSPLLALRLFNRSIDKSPYLDCFKSNDFKIKRKSGPIHLDGDPYEMNGELQVKVLDEKLRVLF